MGAALMTAALAHGCSGAEDRALGTSDAQADEEADDDAGDGGSDAEPPLDADRSEENDADLSDADDGGTASDADLDAADAAPLEQAIFVSPTGDDTNAGTREMPLRTIASAVMRGTRVVLLDGTFDRASQSPANVSSFIPVTVPDGVSIRADHAGMAILEGRSDLAAMPNRTGLTFARAGALSGVVLRGFSNAILASQGELTLDGVRFEQLSSDAIRASGSAIVRLSNAAGVTYTDATTRGLANIEDSAELHVRGGRLTGGMTTVSCSMFFRAVDQSKLFLEDLQLEDSPLGALTTGGTAQVSLRNVTIERLGTTTNCFSVIYLNGTSSKLTLQSSAIRHAGWGGISNNADQPSVQLIDSEITDSTNVAVSLFGPAVGARSTTLEARNSHFDRSGLDGLELNRLLDVKLEQVSVVRSARDGLRVSSTANLRVRNSVINENGWAGVYLLNTDNAAAVLDLGTRAEPGGNTFTNSNFVSRNASSDKNVYVQTQSGVTAYAVGNTWNATQGADAQGHYAAAAGSAFDGTNATSAGLNFAVVPAGAQLRLAESP